MVLFFYIFAFLLVISALGVVLVRNPVVSIIYLIFAFFNAAGLFLLLGAEFLSMMLVIVYVGAIAVLFLFVVMMLDTEFSDIQTSCRGNLSVTVLFGVLLFCDLCAVTLLSTRSYNIDNGVIDFVLPNDVNNVQAIAMVLYTDFILPFQISGIILFVAMIACIFLTLKKRKNNNVRYQNTKEQLLRNKGNSVQLINLGANHGVSGIKYD